jgi:hypothetical protein
VPESKECRLCHRIGYRGYAISGDYGWVCTRDDLCRARQSRAAKEEADERWNTGVDWLLNHPEAQDIAPLFWAYQDGIITHRELREGVTREMRSEPVDIITVINLRRGRTKRQ